MAVMCRTVLTRVLLGMQDGISMDVLCYQRDPERGWGFKAEAPGCTPDTVNGGIEFIRELYEKQGSKGRTVRVYFLHSLCSKTLQSLVVHAEHNALLHLIRPGLGPYHRLKLTLVSNLRTTTLLCCAGARFI